MDLNAQSLIVQLPNKRLDFYMVDINKAEARLMEVAIVNPVTANELCAFFNVSSGQASKYIGLLESEILLCKKEYDLAKATVLLDKLPAEIIKIRDQGIKPNDDWREAHIRRDPDCTKWQDAVDELKAAQAFINSKFKCFERAYYACYKEKDRKQFTPTTNINGYSGMTDNGMNSLPIHQKDFDEMAKFYGGNNEQKTNGQTT